MSKVSVPLLLVTALLAGCAGAPKTREAPVAAPQVQVPAPVASAGPAPDDNLNAVAWTQTAVEHDLIYREVYRVAGEKLPGAMKSPKWDALAKEDRQQPLKGLKPAVILDIDETVLDNSPYQARLVRDGASYNEATWAAWCREKAAKPMPGALEFTRLAARHGVTVFYLSNRAQDLNAATLENLREAGFPVAGEEVFLGLGTVVDGCEQNGSEKGCRRQLVGRKYRVLMQFGDQLGDFVDVLANTPDGRRAAVAPYLDWVGDRWFVLPNPTYGSWEPALFNNAWSEPAESRRRAKIEALRY
ncbi:5'-nucleotidase, lipoprotein e(P4) family [Dokdonella sp.]|uniref:5'-nucleotidase, lipoprotein e(P4) family n=1 Tax=Dokdonella sp. TaxID=2291710 RepID=UPI002638EEF7|nr:5'-nucleotidase, lipoprotein e(P4) family [Dokdonella sp.]